MRVNDSIDPMHGPRAAVLARELRGGPFDLGDEEMDLLAFACEEHTNGKLGKDQTIGVCWDADRLNLWRVGFEPDPRFLSTEAARSEERIAWAHNLQQEIHLGRVVPGLHSSRRSLVTNRCQKSALDSS